MILRPRCYALLLLLATTVAQAGLPALTPASARFKVTVNGVPVGTAAAIDVRHLEGTRYEATFNVRNRFMHHHEVSRFDWEDCRVQAREYLHDFTGLGLDRHSAIVFDRERNVAVETRGGKRVDIPLDDSVTDGLNMALAARCRLREGAQSLDFPIIYRGERRDMRFRVVGRERVQTPVGTFDSLVVERIYPQGGRKTRVWVAPALDWFMVRLEHVENPVARGSMVITGFRQGDLQYGDIPPEKRPSAKSRQQESR